VIRLNDVGSVVTFTIASFSLALVLILKKDSIPAPMRRVLALIAIVLVSSSFFLILFSILFAKP
jgi:hypothetical protein